MVGPEALVLLLDDQLVEGVGLLGVFEGQVSKDEREEDDSQCEDVGPGCIIGVSVVSVAFVDFRGHVALFRTFIFTELDVLGGCLKSRCESEVTDFEDFFSFLSKHENVLQFEVAVGDAFGVEVGEALRDLPEGCAFGSDVRLGL